MDFSNRKAIHDPWGQESGQTFLSPKIDEHWEHIVLFPDDKDNDYAIEVELSLLQGEVLNNQIQKTAGVIIRYSGEDQYYYAGLGGFGARTFIGVVKHNEGRSSWSCLESLGRREEIEFNRSYWFRVECQGAKLSVYDDRGNKLSVEANSYPTGHYGFRTVRTQARFANLTKSGPSILKAFVIMPFTASLSFVYETIREVVEEDGLECHRVDEFTIARPVIDDIKDWLVRADLIIADLTDKNPNVYYETGFAHALNKKLIFIAQSPNDLAFNVRGIRTLFYKNPQELCKELKRAIGDALAAERGHIATRPK